MSSVGRGSLPRDRLCTWFTWVYVAYPPTALYQAGHLDHLASMVAVFGGFLFLFFPLFMADTHTFNRPLFLDFVRAILISVLPIRSFAARSSQLGPPHDVVDTRDVVLYTLGV